MSGTGTPSAIALSTSFLGVGLNMLPIIRPGRPPFDGLIDDVRVWNVERTATEIADNYNKELTGSETGLVGYWKLNSTLGDSTANNNDLTNNNGAIFSTENPFIPQRQPFSDTTNLEFAVSLSRVIQNYVGHALKNQT